MSSRFAAMSDEEPRQVDDGAVENLEEKMWRDADTEHHQGDRDDDELLSSHEIRKRLTALGQGTAEEHLHGSQESYRGEKQPEHGDGGRNHRETERALEDEELTDKPVRPGRPSEENIATLIQPQSSGVRCINPPKS